MRGTLCTACGTKLTLRRSCRYLILRNFVRVVRHLRARGLLTAAREAYLVLVRKGFACMLLLPSVRNKVQGELDQVTLDLASKVCLLLPTSLPIPDPASLVTLPRPHALEQHLASCTRPRALR